MISRDQTRQNYDRLSRWYDLFASSEKKFTEAGLKILNVGPGERVLEIGFGTGHSLVKLAQSTGPSGLVVGVELSTGMIETARKRWQAQGPEGSARMICGDGTRLPILRNTFDAVFLSFTLELFSDRDMQVVLAECQRVLKPDGRLGVVSLSAPVERSGPGAKGNTLASRLYEWGHEHWPTLLDCKPINLKGKLEAGGFHVQSSDVMKMWGLPVEIVLGWP